MGDKWRPAYTERLKAAGFMRAYMIGDRDAAGEGEPGALTSSCDVTGAECRGHRCAAHSMGRFKPEGYDITDFCDEYGADAKARLRERIEAVKGRATLG